MKDDLAKSMQACMKSLGTKRACLVLGCLTNIVTQHRIANMTKTNPPFEDSYFLLNMWIFQCHVSFQGCNSAQNIHSFTMFSSNCISPKSPKSPRQNSGGLILRSLGRGKFYSEWMHHTNWCIWSHGVYIYHDNYLWPWSWRMFGHQSQQKK